MKVRKYRLCPYLQKKNRQNNVKFKPNFYLKIFELKNLKSNKILQHLFYDE